MSNDQCQQCFGDRLIRVLNSYSGRDKAMRTLHFSLGLFASTRTNSNSPMAIRLRALAKQLSNSRLVWRQLSQLSLLTSAWRMLTRLHHSEGDTVDEGLSCACTLTYTVNSFVEMVAWLADAKLMPAGVEAAGFFRYSLRLWIAALILSSIQLTRQLYLFCSVSNKSLGRASNAQLKSLLLALLSTLSDLLSALNQTALFPLLRMPSLRPSHTTFLSLLASIIGFYNAF